MSTRLSSLIAKQKPPTDIAEAAGQPVRRVSDAVAGELLKAITNKTLADEQNRLPSERELAEHFQVSRTSVREALLHLQSIGIIEIPNRARARVVDMDSGAFYEQLTAAARVLMSKQQIYEFQEARALFECAIVRYAARHATPKQLGRLRAALLENERSQNDPPRFIETDMAFHRVLTEIPSNPIFMSMQTAIDTWFAEQRVGTFAPEAETGARELHAWQGQEPLLQAIRESYSGHEAIVVAVESGDPDVAERAMSDHLMLVFNYMLKSRNRAWAA